MASSGFKNVQGIPPLQSEPADTNILQFPSESRRAPVSEVTYTTVANPVAADPQPANTMSVAMAKSPAKPGSDVSWPAINLVVGLCMAAIATIGGFIIYDLHGMKTEVKALNGTVTDIRIEAVKTNGKLDQIIQQLQKP